jgi:hypothetical protein
VAGERPQRGEAIIRNVKYTYKENPRPAPPYIDIHILYDREGEGGRERLH